MNILLRINFH